MPPVFFSTLKRPRIVLFGDSHSHAVHVAVERRLAKGVAVPLAVFRPRKYKESGAKVGNTTFPDFLDLISSFGPDDLVLSMIGGNHYAAFSGIQHPQPFDFFTRVSAAAVAEGVDIIPYMAVSAYFFRLISKDTGRRLKALRNATQARVVHLVLPPPIADNDFIAGHLKPHLSARGIASTGVSSPELRLKCWQLQRLILHKICHSLGIEIMPPPPKAVDGGFLRAKYYGHDSTHANWLYGELVLREVEARFHRPDTRLLPSAQAEVSPERC